MIPNQLHYKRVNIENQLARALERLARDPAISDTNKQLIKRYVNDGALGKLGSVRAKKRIQPATLLLYLNRLLKLVRYVKKDLDKLTQEDMEGFIIALESGKILSDTVWHLGNTSAPAYRPLSHAYRLTVKVTIRQFYKWLFGRNREFPALVSWIDTHARFREVPALTRAEVRRLIDRASSVYQRAIIQVLFDGGFRISELLNILLSDTRLLTIRSESGVHKCFSVRITVSKTLPRTVVLPMEDTTKWLGLWLEDHPAHPKIQGDGSIIAGNASVRLFTMGENSIRAMLTRFGKRTLGKRVYPHLLRHSSATFWCSRLSTYQLCKRFGWAMTSKMPQRYIDREGIDELDVARIYQSETARSEPDAEKQINLGIR